MMKIVTIAPDKFQSFRGGKDRKQPSVYQRVAAFRAVSRAIRRASKKPGGRLRALVHEEIRYCFG
jgi:hypothetical protein